MPTLLMSPMSSRIHLPVYLMEHDVSGDVVEIGTHRGDYALAVLAQWNKGVLWCVDPYTHGYSKIDPAALGDRRDDMNCAKELLQGFSNWRMLNKTSKDAASHFVDGSLAMVYVDGNHEPPHPLEDLERWYPKVKSGGVLAIHDVVCPGEINGGWGQYVFPALYSFASKINAPINLIVEEGNRPWTGYVIK